MKKINTIIIGAGQSGLSVSYFLKNKGIEHVILEKGEVGDDIRNRRWDAFHLITPNHMTNLPGFPYKGKYPKGFDSRDQLVKHLENYAKSFNAPILEKTEVLSVKKNKEGFLIKTKKGEFETKNVVVAVGSFHKPLIPILSKKIPKNIFQIHSSEYKSPKQLPKGSVLIVGGGNSGIQIAVDLLIAGRKVYLSLGRLRIVPRNYRDKDFMEWADLMGALDRTTEEATPEIKTTLAPLLYGYQEDVNLRKLANDGATLLGRLTDYINGEYLFDSSLIENIEEAEAGLMGFKAIADKLVSDKKLKVAKGEKELEVQATIPIVTNLEDKDVTSVIWSTGFQDNWSWLQVPVFNENGNPFHTKGVSKIPRLYFIGLRWLSKYKSFLLCGVGEDAEYIASKIR